MAASTVAARHGLCGWLALGHKVEVESRAPEVRAVGRPLEQAALLGMPGYRMVLVPHPVQLLTAAELDARADTAFAAVLRRLTG